jgi:formate dehydrogenase assembly factor FdhD
MRQPPLARSDLRLSAEAITAALVAMPSRQEINRQTHAVHAAGF